MIEALRDDGWWVEVLEWPASFPFPNEDDRLDVAASLASLPDNALVLIDGLALGALPGLARREKDRLRLAALVPPSPRPGDRPVADDGGHLRRRGTRRPDLGARRDRHQRNHRPPSWRPPSTFPPS
ncbi:MAG: hypothetical protein WDN45_02730 [Caulobacteraceae bacterium]